MKNINEQNVAYLKEIGKDKLYKQMVGRARRPYTPEVIASKADSNNARMTCADCFAYVAMIAPAVLVIAAYMYFVAYLIAMVKQEKQNTIIAPEQIEADYAGRMFLNGRIKSIDESELERMSPAIKEAVLNKL